MSPIWVSALYKVLGKRIKGVVVAEQPRSPENRVFLIFDDDTYFELYGSDIRGCKDLDKGGSKLIIDRLRRNENTTIQFEATAED